MLICGLKHSEKLKRGISEIHFLVTRGDKYEKTALSDFLTLRGCFPSSHFPQESGVPFFVMGEKILSTEQQSTLKVAEKPLLSLSGGTSLISVFLFR